MKTLNLLLALTSAAALYAQQPADPSAAPAPQPAQATPADPFLKSQAPAPADPFSGGGDARNSSALPAEVLARVEIFSLPHTLARKVQRQFPKSADLYAWLDAELQKPQSEVKLEHLSALKIRGGQRSKLESLDEYPWPTEFDPGQIPQTYSIGQPLPDQQITNVTNVTKPEEPKRTPPAPGPVPPKPVPAPQPVPGPQGDSGAPGTPAPVHSPPLGSFPDSLPMPPWCYTPTTPNAFQFRNTGWTLEIEATIEEDGETVDFNLAPEMVRITGIQSVCPSNEVENPIFETSKLSGQILAKMNQPYFAGTFSRPLNSGVQNNNTENRVRLLFVTPVKPAPEIPTPSAKSSISGVQTGRVTFDCFSLPLPAARQAMLTNPKEQELFRWLDTQIEKPDSGVVMEQTHTLLVRGGQRSKMAENDEYPWPTEMDPPQIPQTVSIPKEAKATPTGVPGYTYPAWPRTPLAPNSIQFRVLGWSSEVELTFSEDGWLADMNVAPEYVRLAGSVAWGAAREAVQPVFETQKMQANVSAVISQPTLVSTFSPPVNTGAPGGNTKDRVWFLFVTVTRAE